MSEQHVRDLNYVAGSAHVESITDQTGTFHYTYYAGESDLCGGSAERSNGRLKEARWGAENGTVLEQRGGYDEHGNVGCRAHAPAGCDPDREFCSSPRC